MNFIVDEPLYGILMVLADLFIKGLLILLGARILTGLLARSAAAARHLIWATALIMILMLPLFAAVLPRVSVPLIPQPFEARIVESNAFSFPGEGAQHDKLAVPAWKADQSGATASGTITSGAASSPAFPQRLQESSPATDDASFFALRTEASEQATGVLSPIVNYVKEAHWSTLILGVWGLGITAVLLWTLMGLAGAWWITMQARAPEGESWDDLAEELADRLLVYRPVTLKMSASIASPMTWGAWRPVILLPIDADDWSDERRRYVLLHEMAHIKRWDTLTQLGAQLGCALHWFNPMAWQGLQRMRIEQEKACDDMVLSQGMKASAYASHLLDIARSLKMSWVSPLNTISMAKPSQLEGRVVDILDPARKKRTLNRVGTVLTCMLAAAVMVPITALSPWQLAESSAPADGTQTQFLTQSTASGFAMLSNNHMLSNNQDGGQHKKSEERRLTAEIIMADNDARLLRLDRIDRRSATPDTSEAQRRARKTAIKALRKSLRDENAEVRSHAVLTLGEMNDVGAIGAITELARRDPDTEVRRFAIIALSELDADEAVDVYIDALADGDREVRQYAAMALADIDNWRATDALIAVLEDGDPDVRRHALLGLADRRERDALPAISNALRDSDPDIRRFAVMALSEYDDDESLRLLTRAVKDSDADVRSHAIMAIADRADDESMPLFIDLLKSDKDPEIRKYAAIALGEIGDVGAVDALTQALEDKNSEVRRYATMALSELDYGNDSRRREVTWNNDQDWDNDQDWNNDQDWDNDQDWNNDQDWDTDQYWDGAEFGEAMAQIGVSASQIGLAVGELSLNLTAQALEEVAYSLEGFEFDAETLAELDGAMRLSKDELREAMIELEELEHELEHEWSDEDFDSLLELMHVVGPVLSANPELCEQAAGMFEEQSQKRRKRALEKLSCSTNDTWDN